jgi:AcrR family transcriptional regulator
MLASVSSIPVSNGPAFKRLPRAVREQQMLDSAVRVFSRRGYHAASMDEIAEDAGISKPMVYAYLGSKEELFLACVHREGTRMLEAIVAVVSPELPADQQLWRGLKAFYGFVGDHRDGWAVLYRQARGRQPFVGEIARLREQIIGVVAGMFARAVAAHGREAKQGDLMSTANALVGAAESLADWLADHPEADPERTATRMMNIAWLGAGQLLHGQVWRPDE